ncbi:MAG TPA: betaine/proline/choline family ABC transporter ATP-binding protein [Candidatus Limnocylindrales bacterium]|nr:betaine/proline/choline family ABC transporter ATP-binding protein [Candidatus Limnocylindrales bacterium]
MTEAAAVTFEHVTKRYARTGQRGGGDANGIETAGAVNDLSLEVPAGKVCVLVGPSGCGKTTSLKMVNRLIEPTSGRILIGGEDVARRDVIGLRREIGYVIQQVGLFPHQTIVENVETVPRLLGWPAPRRRSRSTELLELVGLDPASYAGRYPSQLSGGERQRVGVARALAADPPVLLMDEPFGAVDPIVRERLQNELLHLQDQLAKTILFVTHDIDEAIKMGDLVAVMQAGGRLAQFGPPAEILASPASEFVARFVGADRGLKRLSLSRVGELELKAPVVAHAGDDPSEVRRALWQDPMGYLLLLDDRDRPLGWIDGRNLLRDGALTPDLAFATSPLLDRRTTLKDALSMLLDADVQAGIVVSREGALRGIVTAATIAEFMREAARALPPDESPEAAS